MHIHSCDNKYKDKKKLVSWKDTSRDCFSLQKLNTIPRDVLKIKYICMVGPVPMTLISCW